MTDIKSAIILKKCESAINDMEISVNAGFCSTAWCILGFCICDKMHVERWNKMVKGGSCKFDICKILTYVKSCEHFTYIRQEPFVFITVAYF